MGNCELTFVVPCYNVEKYIQDCLDSIFSVSIDSALYEVLCVNDCSPDNTQVILESNIQAHSNLRIVKHETNKGLGGARNTGLREAKGKYVWFVDSDDYINSHMVSHILSNAVNNNVDVCAFNYRNVNSSGETIDEPQVFSYEPPCDGYSFVKKVFGRSFQNHLGYVWRFLYNVDFLKANNLFFPEHVYWEDTIYIPKSVFSSRRIMSVPYVGYCYRHNSSSVSGQFHKLYSAELICQMAFFAGGELLKYSQDIEDEWYSNALKEKALSLINDFSLFLLRSNSRERKRFYSIMEDYFSSGVRSSLTIRNKIFIQPFLGRILLSIITPFYRLKRKMKC